MVDPRPKAANPKNPSIPRPSASVLLISPSNQILLLHRVQTSSSFPSAHVFPGGNLSPSQDGHIPPPEDPARHSDSLAYRIGALRETFEESGILLAKNGKGELLEVGEEDRDRGRRGVHGEEVRFTEWVGERGGVLDTEGLIPFTRWVTPPNLAKRFTTQMYIYFLPLAHASSTGAVPTFFEAMIANPTPDGGIEHTTAKFLPCQKWLDLSRSGDLILFPPQFYLLHLLAPFLPPSDSSTSHAELSGQREKVMEFVHSGDPPFTEMVISPMALLWKNADGRAAMGLDKPAAEVKGLGIRGDSERVILVEFSKGGPRRLEVVSKKELFREEREGKGGGEKL